MSLRSTSRDRGPAIANCAHCSETETSCTSSAGHSTCAQNSRCCMVRTAFAVVRHHDEALGREPRHRAVVHHEAVLAQQQRIARLADRKRREGVGADPVEEHGGIRALDLDLAEGRDVAHADAAARGGDFAVDGFEPVLLAGARVILRAQPRAGFDEHGALLRRPLVRGREPDRTEVAAAVMARPSRRSSPARRAGGTWWCRPAECCGRKARRGSQGR